MTRVKICGLTRIVDLEVAIEAGADAVGLILEPTSPRFLTRDQFNELARRAGPFCTVVAVYGIAGAPYPQAQAYQAHVFEENPPGLKIAAYGISGNTELPEADAILLDSFSKDAFGGTGRRVDWNLAGEFVFTCPKPVVLAGGLNPDNVAIAIEKVKPYSVDVSSGVEVAPGIKDAKMIRDFIQAARG